MGVKQVSVAKDGNKIAFTQHLLEDIKALDYMIQKGLVETGIRRMGAEQELCFVDQQFRPAPYINRFLRKEKDPHFTVEFLKFNLEINLDPLELTGNCFSRLEKDLTNYIDRAAQVSKEDGVSPILTGILPTVKQSDLRGENLTPSKRFSALLESFNKARGGAFEFHIKGIDELSAKTDSGLIEGVNTSFQVHYQLNPLDAVREYNWALALAGPVLACASNSPLLLGKRLWHETRIALFQQSFDLRRHQDMFRKRIPRVSFGTGWVKESITEIFKEDLARYQILLSADRKERPLQILKSGKFPQLIALKTHGSTVYKWNRLCYDLTHGVPHIRIENRYLPSGPSIKDEIANSALWLGLMLGLPKDLKIDKQLNFDDAKNNFLKAARAGIGAELTWLERKRIPAQALLIDQLIPLAQEGLEKADVNSADIELYLGIIRDRISNCKTGSRWMLDSYARLSRNRNKERAIVALTAGMLNRQESGKPVHEWTLAKIKEAGSPINWCFRIDQIMSTDLITVNEDDLIELVARIMDWRHIGHVPVENEDSEIVGLITPKELVQYYDEAPGDAQGKKVVKEIMITNPVSVTPESLTLEAMQLMLKKGIDSLPVVKDKKLVGIVTVSDIMRISARVFKELTKAK